jgi:pyruvate-ferredoxin/flavodoxin oxidoreductase
MFRYDANKQAYLADAAAGTFDELVRAAEKCPARCIRTGAPPKGDPTVDDALVARAAKFR